MVTVDLVPSLQLKDLEAPVPNRWRLLAGPEDSDAPTIIRNDVRLYATLIRFSAARLSGD